MYHGCNNYTFEYAITCLYEVIEYFIVQSIRLHLYKYHRYTKFQELFPLY